MPLERPAEPWLSFLTALDSQLGEPVDFHSIGGFVVSQHYGLGRETADLDILRVSPRQSAERAIELAGRGSLLHKRFRVYLDLVTVANYPEDYETRLVRAFPAWSNVCLWVLEPHDLALTKLDRSNDRDIRDVIYMAHAGLLDRDTLVGRFETEYEPNVIGRTPTWLRTTLGMWIAACWPD